MKIEFPLTLKAVRQEDKSQWAVGDALLREIKPGKKHVNDKSWKQISNCAAMLKEQGYPEYSARTLRDLRDAAAHFPQARRHASVSVNSHRAAGSPDNLDRIIEALKKVGKALSRDNVRMVLKAWREKDKAERAEKKAEAVKKRKAAEARKAKAASQAERDRAAREEEEAKREESKYSEAPPSGDMESDPPEKSELEVTAICLKLEADATRITKMLKNNMKELDGIIDRIDPEFINGIVKYHTRIITAAEEIINKVTKQKVARFKVHQGGAA